MRPRLPPVLWLVATVVIGSATLTVTGPPPASAMSPAAQPAPQRAAGPAPHSATLLFFNDAHEIGPDWTGRGGVARLATAVRSVEAQTPATHVLFGGDLAGGTLFGGLYKGLPIVDALNTVGVDLAGFGQHDFDFGVENTRALVAASDFPWITSNLANADGSPFVKDGTWTVQRVGKVRVGFVGLTDAMETTSVAGQVVDTDPIEAARAAVADLRAHAIVDVIVALSQYQMSDNHELARAVPELDAVFGEEVAEYDSVVEYEGDVPIMTPEGNIGSLIRLDVSKRRGEYVVKPSVIEVDHTVAPDPQLRQVEERYAAEMDALLSETLADMRTPLLGGTQLQAESALGDFVADAFRQHHHADIGWVNGGGLRNGAPGPVFTLRDAYSITPFSNRVLKVEVSGTDLKKSLEDGVSQVAALGGGFPQVSGMEYSYSPTAPVGSRIGEVTVGGRPLDPGASYTVAVTNYVVGGGNGVSGFIDADVLVPLSEAAVDAEVIAEHARDLGVIDVATDGRITVLP